MIKITQVLLFLLVVMLMWVSPALAQSNGADFELAVADYQQSHSTAAAEKVIKLAAAMDRLPAIPEEARRHFVRGTALFKDASSPDDFQQVLDEFKQATRLAPWWPEVRYNWALAYEAASNYHEAIDHLNLYLLFKLPESEARTVQDKIYALEAKLEKEERANRTLNSAEAIVAREKKQFAEWIQKLDGAKFTWDLITGGGSTIIEYTIKIQGTTLHHGFVFLRDPDNPHLINQFQESVGQTEITGLSFTKKATSLSETDRTYTISEDGDTIRERGIIPVGPERGKPYEYVYRRKDE
jgi:tetratricopeptide (TPR) repeat protein